MNMQFELPEALMDDILFAMEDQVGDFMLDTVEAVVIDGLEKIDPGECDGEGALRYICLPPWDSSDGFRLMEQFTARLRNPIVREELTSALSQGRGVFRAFKDTLTRYPEAEKLWFLFKDSEMKKEITGWYNALREEWGLEKIGLEPEETDDLVSEDFRIRPFREEDIPQTEELHCKCLDEYKGKLTENAIGLSLNAVLLEAQALEKEPSNLPPKNGLVAESRAGELAGYISVKGEERILYVQRLEVSPEFRGLGIGEALLSKVLENIGQEEVDQVFFDLPAGMENFSRVLHRESFKPYMTRYWLKLRDRQ